MTFGIHKLECTFFFLEIVRFSPVKGQRVLACLCLYCNMTSSWSDVCVTVLGSPISNEAGDSTEL